MITSAFVLTLLNALSTWAIPQARSTDFSKVDFTYFGQNEGIQESTHDDIFSIEIPKEYRGNPLPVDGDQHTYRATPQGQTSCMHNAGGWLTSNGDPIVVGVPDKYWNGAQGCGQCFYAENAKDPSKHVLVVGADYCMGCDHFDFHRSALKTLGFAEGNAPKNEVNIYAVPCPWPGKIKVARGLGSKKDYLKLIVVGSKYPISSVSLKTTLKQRDYTFEGKVEGAAWKFDFNNDYADIGYNPGMGYSSSFQITFKANAFGREITATTPLVDIGDSLIPYEPPQMTAYNTNVFINGQSKVETNDYPYAETYLQKLILVDTGVQFE